MIDINNKAGIYVMNMVKENQQTVFE